MRNLQLKSGLFMCLVMLSSLVFGDVGFYDGFETYSLGSLSLPATPPTGTSWSMLYQTLFDSITVQDSIVKEGDQALEIVRGSTTAYIQGYVSGGSCSPEVGYDIITKQSWYRPANTEMVVHQRTINGQHFFAWYVNSSGSYYVWNGVNGEWQYTGVAAGTNQWETVELVAHITDAGSGQITGTVDMWLTVDGGERTLIAKSVPLDTRDTPTDSIKTWIMPSGGASTTYWDEISIEKKPSMILGDNFESHSLGALADEATPDFGNPWNVEGTSDVTVQGTTCFEGAKALRIGKDVSETLTLEAFSNSTYEADYDLVIELDRYQPAEYDSGDIVIRSSAGDEAGVAMPRGSVGYPANYEYYNPATSSYVDTGVPVESGKWVNFLFRIKLEEVNSSTVTGTYDLYVTPENGNTVILAKNIALGNISNTSSLSLLLDVDDAASSEVINYFDDICVRKVDHIGYEYGVFNCWADSFVTFGPETDPAQGSPEAIHNMIQYWRDEITGNGWVFSDIFIEWTPWWLLDGVWDELIYFNPNYNPYGLFIFETCINLANSFDVIGCILDEAENQGINAWVYRMPYNDGTLTGTYFPYQYQFTADSPQYITVDRDGDPHYGIREMAYSAARAEMVQQFVDMVNEYDLTHILVNLKTEMGLPSFNFSLPEHADQYGFNTPIVSDMQTLYSVNILTDSRFDYDDPGWDPDDQMVNNWRDLRGSYFTQFLRDLRTAMDTIDSDIKIGILCCRGDYMGEPYGNMKQQWRTWVDEGLVDTMVLWTSLGSPIGGATDELYIGEQGVGVLPFSTFHNYIASSNHPEIKLYRGSTVYTPDVDGGMFFSITDDAPLALAQRAEQVEDILSEDGYITWIEQDFDSFEPYGVGWTDGGLGDSGFYPSLNKSQGFWMTVGDGTDPDLPVIQDSIYHGPSGNAARLKGTEMLEAKLNRSTSVQCPDRAFESGYVTLDFWVYRHDSNSSFLAAVTSTGGSYVAAMICGTGQDGAVAVSNNGWVSTGKTLAAGQWHRIHMVLDLDSEEYSIYTGANADVEIYTDAVWTTSDDAITRVRFIPGGTSTNITYFDDVTGRWAPESIPSSIPPKATNPLPLSGSSGLSVSTVLSWTKGGYATSHNVYFGTDSTPDETEYIGNQTAMSYDPGILSPNTTYYWRIDEVGPAGTTTGDVWSFTTAAPVTMLSDGFESGFGQWTTDWVLAPYMNHTGSYSTRNDYYTNDLTSADIDISGCYSVTITFWYRDSGVDDDDDVYLQLYDGTGYDNKFELGTTSPESTWHEYSATIYNTGNDTQYFHEHFNIKIEGSLIDWAEYLWIDDVSIVVQP